VIVEAAAIVTTPSRRSLPEPRREKTLNVLVVEPPAFGVRANVESASSLVSDGRAAGADRLDLGLFQTGLQPERRMERHRPRAGVGRRVGEEHGRDGCSIDIPGRLAARAGFASEKSVMYRGLFPKEPSMPVDLSAVRRIAHLARIGVSGAETPHLQDEINAILKFVEALSEVDVEGVEPMTSVTPMRLPMREDVVTDGEIAQKVLANAPLTEDGFFLVPKVIE
jgi:aspartyl-tRNA(Asn)/glutamyl-tRNA(Gln) amidotransferase subunit C